MPTTARHDTALVRYTNSFTTRVPSTVFIRAIDSFLEGVTGRLVLTSKEESGLSVLLPDLMQERQDPDIAWWRQLEAAMGYDPDVAPEPLLTAIGTLVDHYGPDPVREVAAFSRDRCCLASPGTAKRCRQQRCSGPRKPVQHHPRTADGAAEGT